MNRCRFLLLIVVLSTTLGSAAQEQPVRTLPAAQLTFECPARRHTDSLFAPANSSTRIRPQVEIMFFQGSVLARRVHTDLDSSTWILCE